MNSSVPHERVSVVGAGYVGLVTGACLASAGHVVICVDTDATKVARINARQSPIFEPGLDELLAALPAGQLTATTDLLAAVADTSISIIAVGTPFDGERIDLTHIETAAASIGEALRVKAQFHVVVVKSTVVPGTTDGGVTANLERSSGKRAGIDFGVAMNPEFLRQGEALHDFMFPDRIVIGANDDRSAALVAGLYEGFDRCPIVRTSTRTAEMIKYTANSLLATLISFSNEIGNLCDALGDIDAVEVMRGVHLDRRLTPTAVSGERVMPGMLSYLQAGCGFGGSCFPKDVKALVAHGVRAGSPMPVLEAVLAINQEQPLRMLDLLRKHRPIGRGLRVAVLGLAFKPDTDDMRESPAIPIVRTLLESGAVVTGYDPAAAANAARLFGAGVALATSVHEAVADADAVLVLTSWPEFAELPAILARRVPQPVVIDGRRSLRAGDFERYEAIGLGRRLLEGHAPTPAGAR